MQTFTYCLVGELRGEEFSIAQDVSFQEAIEMSVDYNHMYDKIHIRQEYQIIRRHENMLVVSDTRGMLKETKRLIDDRPTELDEQLVFLGNFLSSEEPFVPYLDYLVYLNSTRDCVFVLGRMEHNLLEYIHQTHRYIGLQKEIEDFIFNIEAECGFHLTQMKQEMPDVYALLSNALQYYETDAYIFVSGGLDLSLPSWRKSLPESLFQTTPDFLTASNTTGKTIVFGTVPVRHLNTDEQNRPWLNRSQEKIGINGDIRNYGKLIGLLIHEDDRYFISIRHASTRNVAEAYIGNDQLLLGFSKATL